MYTVPVNLIERRIKMTVNEQNIFAMTRQQLCERQQILEKKYRAACARGLQLDMSRGKPGTEQLELTKEMLAADVLPADFRAENGFDVRNYGILEGIPEARRLFGDILHMPAEQVIVGGNSSLNLMFDYLTQAFSRGVCGEMPWASQKQVKFLCPAPGYDRHFAVTAFYDIEMIPVAMTETGPDMQQVEELITDPSVKGMWCVPMYSNPDGITYSDETVRRLAAMKPAAKDFRILWDNAYCLHHLYEDDRDRLLDIYPELVKCGNEDRVIMFTSTSKISFPGAGVAALAASPANIADIRRRMTVQTIGYDKINMLRHVRYFKDMAGIESHMKRHAAILRPRFRTVLETLERELGGKGIATWHTPKGGYFVSVNLTDGCAGRTVALLKQAGVTITGAGATYPYGKDPHDSNLRIAPSYPSLPELHAAMELFCLCAEMAAVERRLTETAC